MSTPGGKCGVDYNTLPPRANILILRLLMGREESAMGARQPPESNDPPHPLELRLAERLTRPKMCIEDVALAEDLGPLRR
jgi:hypothetical protein